MANLIFFAAAPKYSSQSWNMLQRFGLRAHQMSLQIKIQKSAAKSFGWFRQVIMVRDDIMFSEGKITIFDHKTS